MKLMLLVFSFLLFILLILSMLASFAALALEFATIPDCHNTRKDCCRARSQWKTHLAQVIA